LSAVQESILKIADTFVLLIPTPGKERKRKIGRHFSSLFWIGSKNQSQKREGKRQNSQKKGKKDVTACYAE